MGCASSKSTPTVDTNPANNDNLGQTLLNNGKAMAMKSQEDIMNKVDDLKHDIMDTLSIGSRRKEDCDEDDMTESRQEPSSPPTERVHDEDNDMQITDVNEISDETNEAMNTGERTIPITMTLDMEQTENSAEPSEKPPTPMPETASLSDVSLAPDEDVDATSKSVHGDNESVGGNRTNCNTMDSKIMNMICNSAAVMAMNDTEAENSREDSECESTAEAESQMNTMDSRVSRYTRNNETYSDYERNDDNTVSRSSTMSISSYHPDTSTSTAYSTFEKVNKNGRNNQMRSCGNDTYMRLGRKLYNELEMNRSAHGTMMPNVLKLMQQTPLADDSDGNGCKQHKRNRTISLNGNVHFTQ